MEDPYTSGALARLARGMNEELAGQSAMVIGETIRHPDGYMVKVLDGRYLDPIYGCVSNWWTWQRINDDGSPGEIARGYGWRREQIS